MALKQFKPYTKSSRSTILTDRSDLWKGKPYKPLTLPNKSVKGRNNMGRKRLLKTIIMLKNQVNHTAVHMTDNLIVNCNNE